MKKLVMLVSLTILVFGSGISQAQDDMMALIFDSGSNCLDATTLAPYSSFDLFLVLQNPTFPELFGFEAGITVDGPAMMLASIINHPNFVDVGTIGNHCIGFGSPMPMESSNLLITFECFYMSTSYETVCFQLHGSDPSSLDPLLPTALLADGVLLSLGVAPGPGGCTALIHATLCHVTATDSATWDSLKSLYR